MEHYLDLTLALAIGLLIGTERGWRRRDEREGQRVAGIRTFGLLGLAGGLTSLLVDRLGSWLLVAALISVGALFTAAYLQDARRTGDLSVTTSLAAIVTFLLASLGAQGYHVEAAAGAVVVTALLGLKPTLHGWLRSLDAPELWGGLKLLLISVVVLPALPDQGFGPWQAINPREIWWMVVLIAAIEYTGYLAMLWAGPRGGVLLTGLLGGLVSSTATTINLARLNRHLAAPTVVSAGIVIASTAMFMRVVVLAFLINPSLGWLLLWPLTSMTLCGAAGAFWLAFRGRDTPETINEARHQSPLELGPAIRFGLFLALILFLAHALKAWLGEHGIYLLAAISGLADVDAITLSLARMAREQLDPSLAAAAILLAGVVNTGVKAGLAVGIGGRPLFAPVGLTLLIAVAAGGAVYSMI